MTEVARQWQIVNVLVVALPIVLAAVVMLLKYPRSTWLRGGMGVVLAWVASVAFTIWFYNPIGYAYTEATRGAEYAFNRFDNNTIASTMLGGWILPLITVVVFVGCRRLWRRISMRAP